LIGSVRPKGKAIFVALATLLLCAAKMPIYELTEKISPDPSVELGLAKTVRRGDVMLAADVIPATQAILDNPMKVQIDRFETDFSVGDRLSPMAVPPESAAVIGVDAEVFCGAQIETRSATANILIGNWFSKFDKTIRFCLMDADGDMKFDHMFLAGAFDKNIQTGQSISPLPYHREIEQVGPSTERIALKYDGFRNGKIFVVAEFRSGSVVYSVGGISTATRYDKTSYETKYRIDFRSGMPAVSVKDVIGVDFLIDGVDNSGNLNYRIVKNFPPMVFTTYALPTYRPFYVYY
jgi:hypothetical protein